MKTIAEQLNVKEFPFYINDKNGNRIYWESITGYWIKKEYDSKMIYREDNTGNWSKAEYDSKGNRTYCEDSKGHKSDKRVTELTLDQIAEKFGIEVSQLKIKK